MTQTEARAACRANYTDLVTVYDVEDITALINLTGISSAWTGLYRNQSSTKWSNGDEVTFSALSGDCGSGPCCAAMKADGFWESLRCSEKRNFMCYKQDETDLTFSYHLITQSLTWYEAQTCCRKNYTDLVSIRDQEQNKAVKIKGMTSSTPFWIGLLRDDWDWTDGGRSACRNWWDASIHVSDEHMNWESALDYCQEVPVRFILTLATERSQVCVFPVSTQITPCWYSSLVPSNPNLTRKKQIR
ncbi:macrophage mannose receptor 1-like [Salminus brasiliensis]|uniref:macrophage mannose receptor 1-like n=1 Tax=Salminus brasiliensis TaxID=930266 RepID=UPI003B834390